MYKRTANRDYSFASDYYFANVLRILTPQDPIGSVLELVATTATFCLRRQRSFGVPSVSGRVLQLEVPRA